MQTVEKLQCKNILLNNLNNLYTHKTGKKISTSCVYNVHTILCVVLIFNINTYRTLI